MGIRSEWKVDYITAALPGKMRQHWNGTAENNEHDNKRTPRELRELKSPTARQISATAAIIRRDTLFTDRYGIMATAKKEKEMDYKKLIIEALQELDETRMKHIYYFIKGMKKNRK